MKFGPCMVKTGGKYEMSLKAKSYNLAASDLVLKDGSFPVRHCVENADRLMSGEMVVDTRVEGDVSFSSLRFFDWGGEYSETPTTFQLYLQGMQPISYLASAYSVTGNKRYVDLALRLCKSWHRYEGSSASSKNEYVWDQHAAAMRAENLLALLLVATEGSVLSLWSRDFLQRELLRHGRYLSDDSNYLEGENHGAFQDRALLYLGIAFDYELWRDKAKARLDRQWKALFDDDMACRENSFTYQRVNKDLFLAVARVLRMEGDAYGEELTGKIALAEDFMGYALLPDGFCPAFGDTFRFDYSGCPYLDDAGVLAYSSRKGALGVPPAELCKVYRGAGYFFGREHWGGGRGL